MMNETRGKITTGGFMVIMIMLLSFYIAPASDAVAAGRDAAPDARVLLAAKAADPPPDPGAQDDQAGYQKQLEKVMDEVFRVLESIKKKPDLSEEAKMRTALDFLRNVRWGPERKDYFWVNDTQGRMLMDPYIPSLEGKIMLGYEDPNGSRPFAEFVRIGEQKSEGFHEHQWPKYEGKTPVPKRSFVRIFEPWGWIIGTGVYVDVIEAYEDPEP
ncbi:MAG: hypothetical protein GY859_13885, partial [Desulfobacterales bacterium]|nr:hypothetical protein [Desulfobacterales bacterium]